MHTIRQWFCRTRRKLLIWLVDLEWDADLLLWDDDDPERNIENLHEWFHDYIGGDEPAEIKVMRAISLPARTYRVTPRPDGMECTVERIQ